MFTKKHSKRLPHLVVPLVAATTFAAGCRTFTPVTVPTLSPVTLAETDKQKEYDTAVKALDDSVLPFMQELERLKDFYLKQQVLERVIGHNTFGGGFYPATDNDQSAMYVLEVHGKTYKLPKARDFIEACDKLAILDAQMQMEGKTLPEGIMYKTAKKIVSIYQNLEQQEMTPKQVEDNTKEVEEYLRELTQGTLRYTPQPDPSPAMEQKIKDDLLAFIKSHPKGSTLKFQDEYLSQITFEDYDNRKQKLLIPAVADIQAIIDKGGWTSDQISLLNDIKTYRDGRNSIAGEQYSKEWHSEEQVLKLWDISMDIMVMNPSNKDIRASRAELAVSAQDLPATPVAKPPLQHR